MSRRQGPECGPGLSAWWNVLPLFFANYALPRRDTARRVLRAARSANERFHISVPGTCGLCASIIDRPRPASLGFTTFREVRQPRELHRPRPHMEGGYHFFIFSKVQHEDIRSTYNAHFPSFGNGLLYVLVKWRIPRSWYERLRRRPGKGGRQCVDRHRSKPAQVLIRNQAA